MKGGFQEESNGQLNQKVLRDQVRRGLASGFGNEEVTDDHGKSHVPRLWSLFPETGTPTLIAGRRLWHGQGGGYEC